MEANNPPIKQGQISFFKTLFNALNSIMGVGILSVSYALASGGWLSLLLLVAIATAACYGSMLTIRCMDANPTISTYSDIGEIAFGKYGKRVISTILYADLYLALTGYLILEGDNLHNLFPGVKIECFGTTIGGKPIFVSIIALSILPSVWMKNLSTLAYISATGVIAAIVILLSVLWVGVFDGVGFSNKGQLLNLKGIPTAMSLYMFSYGASPVFPTLYTSMEKKHHFSKVLLISFFCATICYTSMAISGYLMYGSGVKSQITLNLPTHRISSKIAIYTAWLAPLSKYALLMEPVAVTTEGWFPKYIQKWPFRILVRSLLVATQVIVALALPFFGSLMSLAGALLCATASITIPCVCFLKISKIGRKSLEYILIMALIVLSLVLVIVGTVTSVMSIISEERSR